MTQLYVGNLSAEGDEKAIRALFSRYGVVREVLMKNGYAFVEFEDACSADTAMRDLNGELMFTRKSLFFDPLLFRRTGFCTEATAFVQNCIFT